MNDFNINFSNSEFETVVQALECFCSIIYRQAFAECSNIDKARSLLKESVAYILCERLKKDFLVGEDDD